MVIRNVENIKYICIYKQKRNASRPILIIIFFLFRLGPILVKKLKRNKAKPYKTKQMNNNFNYKKDKAYDII